MTDVYQLGGVIKRWDCFVSRWGRVWETLYLGVDNKQMCFSFCPFAAMCEMIKIMQEYGEVTCCLGSSANLRNSCLFLQSDIRLGRTRTPPAAFVLSLANATPDLWVVQADAHDCSLRY